MKLLSIEEIISAIEGTIYNLGESSEYDGVCIDTRKLKPKNIYIAIKGDVFNGNKFVEEAVNKGSSLCIVDEIHFELEKVKNATIVKVEDTKKALRDLARYYRSKLSVKVIGVTGSTGKTTTKDLVAAALSLKYKVFKTKGNFNNEIGLPLMVFDMDENYDVAVLEMGMSNLNEIHRLAEVAKPDIAIITNIGISHIENLGSRENILRAKMEITDFFNDKSILVVNAEDDLLCEVQSDKYKVIKIGFNKNNDYYPENVSLLEEGIEYNVVEENIYSKEVVHLDILGRHNILNSILAVACGRSLGIELKQITYGFKNLEATSMRLDIIKTDKYTIINDCYNASPDSMKAALDVQSEMKASRRIAILGTMKELGREAYRAHKETGAYAREKGIDFLIALGEYANAYQEGFSKDEGFIYCENTEEAVRCIKEMLTEGDTVLIKASRAMKFETIVNEIR